MLSWPGSCEDVSVDVFVAQDGSVPVWRKCVWALYFSFSGFSWLFKCRPTAADAVTDDRLCAWGGEELSVPN